MRLMKKPIKQRKKACVIVVTENRGTMYVLIYLHKPAHGRYDCVVRAQIYSQYSMSLLS